MIALYLLILLTWSFVCYMAGEISVHHYYLRRIQQQDTDDMNARDEWAERYINEQR